MKKLILMMLFSTAVFAMAPEEVLETHFNHCGSGVTGWWLKLGTSPSSLSRSGGVSSSTGEFYGCGTCAQCRGSLRGDIARDIANKSESCRARGGEVKSTNEGSWTEEVTPTYWTMRVSGVDILCEKWIPCK